MKRVLIAALFAATCVNNSNVFAASMARPKMVDACVDTSDLDHGRVIEPRYYQGGKLLGYLPDGGHRIAINGENTTIVMSNVFQGPLMGLEFNGPAASRELGNRIDMEDFTKMLKHACSCFSFMLRTDVINLVREWLPTYTSSRIVKKIIRGGFHKKTGREKINNPFVKLLQLAVRTHNDISDETLIAALKELLFFEIDDRSGGYVTSVIDQVLTANCRGVPASDPREVEKYWNEVLRTIAKYNEEALEEVTVVEGGCGAGDSV